MNVDRALSAIFGVLAFFGGVLLLLSDEPSRGVGILLVALIFEISILIGHVAHHTKQLGQIESQLIQMNARQYKMAQWEVKQSKKSE